MVVEEKNAKHEKQSMWQSTDLRMSGLNTALLDVDHGARLFPMQFV